MSRPQKSAGLAARRKKNDRRVVGRDIYHHLRIERGSSKSLASG